MVQNHDARNKQHRISQERNGQRFHCFTQCLEIAGHHIDDAEQRDGQAEDCQEISGLPDQGAVLEEDGGKGLSELSHVYCPRDIFLHHLTF